MILHFYNWKHKPSNSEINELKNLFEIKLRQSWLSKIRCFIQIQVCFEPVSETTLYTEHVLHGANIEAKDKDSSRPSFKSSTGFFSVSMLTVYTQASQLELMTNLLGDAVSGDINW